MCKDEVGKKFVFVFGFDMVIAVNQSIVVEVAFGCVLRTCYYYDCSRC